VAKSRQAVTSMFEEARMGKAVDTHGAQRLVEEISDSVSRNPGALISLARLKTADDYTYMHSVAVCALMIALARQLALDEQQTRSAGIAGLLHDLGKAAMPMEVLNKPGKLTDAEFAIIKSHPEEGYRMLLSSPAGRRCGPGCGPAPPREDRRLGLPEASEGRRDQPFRQDGRGLRRLRRDHLEPALQGRLGPGRIAAQDGRVEQWSFRPAVFQAFVKSIGIYPIGSLVLLNSGRLGVVTEQNEKSLLSPRIKTFFSTRSNSRIRPEVIDLSRPGCPHKIVSREDPAKWNFPDLHEIWSGAATAAR
jgi:putative nucleotidyltransferase with HDIG domain